MEHLIFYVAIATLVFFVAFGMDLVVGNRSIRFLKDLPSAGNPPGPKVSIIIPARNEERNIQEALRSVLSQDYENAEVIVIIVASSIAQFLQDTKGTKRGMGFIHQPADTTPISRDV
jgi:chlorobactene glucosyltransferase